MPTPKIPEHLKKIKYPKTRKKPIPHEVKAYRTGKLRKNLDKI
jgi:hypothetical protein